MSKYLIFGGTGSLGKKLIEKLLYNDDVAVYSRDEAKHWTIKNEFSQLVKTCAPNKLNFFVGDIRDQFRIRDVIRQYKPNNVIIAAALKQVDTCELCPNESIMTNLIGTQNIVNVINDSSESYIKTVLFVSTDKACSPVNVYGMCKALSERVVTSQANTGRHNTKFISVRYGNVLESRGSIIPLFKYQSQHMSHLTVTDPEMTRFVMTLDDSVNLINHAINNGENGSTWIPRLPSMKIGDLANIFSKLSGKPINIIGQRPGEKKHEDLINESESIRTYKKDNFYVIKHSFETCSGDRFSYTSADNPMSEEDLHYHLNQLKIIDRPLEEFKGLNIEEINTHKAQL